MDIQERLQEQQYQNEARLKQQETESNMSLYAPTMHDQMQQHQAVVIEQVNPRKVVEDIILELDGKERNEDGELVDIGQPLMNKDGLQMIKIKLRSIVNQNTIMSHLDDGDIRRLMYLLAANLRVDIGLNWRDYGISSRTLCDTIMDIVIMNAYTALKRAREQNEKNWLGRITVESIQSAKKDAKKDGFLSKFKL